MRDRCKAMVDLRAYETFRSTNDDSAMDCCPSETKKNRRTFAINKGGLVFQLIQDENLAQEFYETRCRGGGGEVGPATATGRPCRFVERRLAPYSRCVQQWTYMYALGQLLGHDKDQVHLDYVRIPTGCKCQVSTNAVGAFQEERH